MILVDTDYVIDFLKGKKEITEQFKELFPLDIAISVITYAEVYQGIFHGQNRQVHEAGFRRFIHNITVLPVTSEIAEVFGILRGGLLSNKNTKHLAASKQNYDLFIATTAIHHDLKLVTRNIKHYKNIPKLKLYNTSHKSG